MDAALQLAIIAAVAGLPATIVPIIIAKMTAKERRQIRIEERRDRDAVAKHAAQAAAAAASATESVRTNQNKVARLLLESNEKVAKVAEIAHITGEKTLRTVQIVHTLVNSDLTKVLQGQLDATEAQLVLVREVMVLKGSPEKEPTKEMLKVIKALETKIKNLKATLEIRARQIENVIILQEDSEKDGFGKL